MRFAIMGVGGAGGYFGARLVLAGHDVSFIARGAHLAAIRASGLRLASVLGDGVAVPAIATDDSREVGVVDYVILGVKAWQVADAVRSIAPLVGPSTAILPLQNGVEAADQIASAVGRPHVLGGIAKVISYYVEPGVVRHVGAQPTLEVGELDGERTVRVQALVDVLARTPGITAHHVDDIQVAMWSKFLFISSWGGVAAVTRAPLGALRELPETRRLLVTAMEEVERVARANDVALPDDIVSMTMRFVDSLPSGGTCSLQRDVEDGKPSEIENLTGTVLRLGRLAGVPTPTNAFLYHSLLPLERRARGQLAF